VPTIVGIRYNQKENKHFLHVHHYCHHWRRYHHSYDFAFFSKFFFAFAKSSLEIYEIEVLK